MKHDYAIKDFAPSRKTIEIVKSFAHTYCPNTTESKCMFDFLMMENK